MKKVIIAASVAMALSAAAHADSTTQLKVKGVLTNDACTPVLSNGGVVDFGTKYIDSLSSTADNQLGHKDLTLTINCPSATKVAWDVIDNNQDTMTKITIKNASFDGNDAWSTGSLFGAGKTANEVKIGAWSFAVDFNNVTADSVTVPLIYNPALETNGSWFKVDNAPKAQASAWGSNNYTASTATGNEPLAFNTAVFPLRVALAVKDTTTLAITDDTPITGQATLSLVYL